MSPYQLYYLQLIIPKQLISGVPLVTPGSIRVSDGGGGVCHLPIVFFFLKMEGASGFQTLNEVSLELCLSQTGLAKNEKLHQTTSS